ncbi:hypothetical protein B0H19DRAFT_1386049 [Mycena capillaripes]|nr:hypothetical protein B0H19DRAFT_1386049 [Mycena capillaripes]
MKWYVYSFAFILHAHHDCVQCSDPFFVYISCSDLSTLRSTVDCFNLPSNLESARGRADKEEDSVKGGDTAKTGTADNGQSRPVGRTYTSSTIINVHGGVGGLGGQGGERGGHGGTGEGSTIPVHNSNVYVTNPDATSMLFYDL